MSRSLNYPTICGIAAVLVLACEVIVAADAGPAIVAHRGASKDAPENTLPAFALAWEQGADAIEGDFRLTRDGKIVCVHDAHTERVSGVKLSVGGTDLEELRELDVGLWKGEEYRGPRIPTLGAVLATVPPGKKIYIEIKCGPEIVAALFEEIGKAELAREQLVIISFDAAVIEAVEDRAPELATFWLTSFKKAKTGEVTPSAKSVFETLGRINTDGVSTGKDLVDVTFVSEVIAKGYQYHVWTVDDPAAAKRFRTWGARSITTNVPAVIRADLRETPGR